MADAEESPSSLADLEALAGLGNAPNTQADDTATDADVGDFDLASLAASSGVGDKPLTAPVADVSADDAPLDLSGLAAAQAPAIVEGRAAAVASTAASPSVPQNPTRGRFGFAYGLIAGVVGAGGLFLLLHSNSEPSASSNELNPPVVSAPAGSNPPAPVEPNAVVARETPVVTADAPAAPETGSAAATGASTTKPRAVGGTKLAPQPSAPATDQSSDTQATNDDPTRPPAPVTPVVEAPEAPARAMDSLLDDALGSGKRPTSAKPSGSDNLMGETLPATPTAADVTQVIQVLLPAIRGCAMGQSGVANTLLVVRNDGRVASASITGAPYAGAASGRCMEGVLRRAKFPRFQQSSFRVQFPLSIRANP